MRLRLPASLAGRLIVVSTAAIALAIVLVCLVMGFMLHRFVVGQIDQRLDAQAFAIAAALRADESLLDDPRGIMSRFAAPPFDRPHSGWTWRVDGPSGPIAGSRNSNGVAAVDVRPLEGLAPPAPPEDFSEADGLSRPHRGDPPGPASLHVRKFSVMIRGEEVRIMVTAPSRAIYAPLRDVLLIFLLSMLGLGVVLIGGTIIQVRFGLLPLERLRAALADVRSGRFARVPEAQPREVAPLAEELNRLIEESVEGLARARRHVANLAHGLKTPLADLTMTLREPGRDPDGAAAALVDTMDQRVRHHLARARAGAIEGAASAATPIASHVADLADALSRIHADRSIYIDIAVPETMVVAVEPQDLDEMLGNLLDNACKWARTQVRIEARYQGKHIRVIIEDDGPGLQPNEVPEALKPGRRLDEMMPGHGFGLPIARELAELYGGNLVIGLSLLGGLAVGLDLPSREASTGSHEDAS